jgi:hypothetical protein
MIQNQILRAVLSLFAVQKKTRPQKARLVGGAEGIKTEASTEPAAPLRLATSTPDIKGNHRDGRDMKKPPSGGLSRCTSVCSMGK